MSKIDLEIPIRKGGGETDCRIERFYIWLTTEYEHPSVAGKHLALSSAHTDTSRILFNLSNNTFPSFAGNIHTFRQ
ncbi:MAG: hypothetical protein ACTSV2_08500 [Candidatus Thorarchaeota archaeon]